MASEEKVFLYSVNPYKTITGLKDIRDIKTAKSLLLTKEDVSICLKNAAVYRRFEDRNEKVTVDNIDRLHNEKFIEAKDWNGVVAEEMSKDHGSVKAPGVEDSSKAVVTEEKVPEPHSEVVIEAPEVTADTEEIVDEATKGAALDEAVDSIEVESDDEAVENAIEG